MVGIDFALLFPFPFSPRNRVHSWALAGWQQKLARRRKQIRFTFFIFDPVSECDEIFDRDLVVRSLWNELFSFHRACGTLGHLRRGGREGIRSGIRQDEQDKK